MSEAPAGHGSRRRYQPHGCRCALCTAANTAAKAAYVRRHPEVIRRSNLKHAHGLTPAQYDQMLEAQGGVCAACGTPEVGRNQYGVVSLAIDHDHATGAVRGLLCMRCNRALGLLGDSLGTISRLLAYREMHP